MIVALCILFCATWICGTFTIMTGLSGAAALRERRMRSAAVWLACCLCHAVLTVLGTLVLLEAVR